MTDRENGGYDQGYQACPCFWGREPGSLVHRLERDVGDFAGWRVLDAGCGEGKNAAYLACLGAQVRALDVSQHAITNAQAAWPECSGITWEVGDIRTTFVIPAYYDLVIAYGLLHCLADKTQIVDVITTLQNGTKIGGYYILCAFNRRHQELEAHPDFHPCLEDHGFYINLFNDWHILEASDSDLTETHPHNGITHTHSMTRILARRV